ncbi:hypothetical protein RFI_06460 [Reticulomyxa filosa]|uniref:Kelch motif family protein n=1 Tax=Reticulomyxa filosa TaxID=46433 RepID=X6NWH1_RETFI|nr:hypothetical protein RFI_06460 [Reticulomyxa filosa]|eukprot:ETO30660.1 hypothetical protein RFI_06460 [Reticulomyxa filosa]
MINQNITPTHFQALEDLPIPLALSQCVLHENELIICGGVHKRDCYSYHTRKNEYKFICKYPSDVKLVGHCVVKLEDNKNDSNETTLLSFGGYYKHTLIMKYVSVWSNAKSKKASNRNQWIPLTNNHKRPVQIGKDEKEKKANYQGVRAVIGGSNNNLLFITYFPKNISVFDLNLFQFIKHDTLPTEIEILFHCFVLKCGMMKTEERSKSRKKRMCEMLLFCKKTGLSIEYNEDNNTFQFRQIPVCDEIAPFNEYAYVCINNIILFFDGWNCKSDDESVVSKLVHNYSIQENKWTTFQNTLPNLLHNCVAVLSDDNTYVHIIGGWNDKGMPVSTHMKAEVSKW